MGKNLSGFSGTITWEALPDQTFFRTGKFSQKTAKSLQRAPPNPQKIDPGRLFSICNASGKPGVEKLPTSLHPEPCQQLIYCVLYPQNVTFQFFSLTTESLQKTSAEPPVGTLNAPVFCKNLEK